MPTVVSHPDVTPPPSSDSEGDECILLWLDQIDVGNSNLDESSAWDPESANVFAPDPDVLASDSSKKRK